MDRLRQLWAEELPAGVLHPIRRSKQTMIFGLPSLTRWVRRTPTPLADLPGWDRTASLPKGLCRLLGML